MFSDHWCDDITTLYEVVSLVSTRGALVMTMLSSVVWHCFGMKTQMSIMVNKQRHMSDLTKGEGGTYKGGGTK